MGSHFVNTHVHTAFSLLDSMVRIPTLVKRVVELGQTACAITDHGTLAGAVKFTETCLKAGVKPLIGQEFYISPDSRLRRKYPKGSHTASHLIIFAKNEVGWQNLMKLSSIGFVEGFYRKPRIDKETLYNYSDGLIVTSACIGGDVATYLKGGVDPEGDHKVDYSRVRALGNADWYMDVFEDDFYFEMQSYGRAYQEEVNAFYRRNFPASQLIASADCHYVFPHEYDTHDTLIACQSVSHKNDPHRWRFVSDQFYVKSEEEMLQHFHRNEVWNTGALADKIDFELPLRKQYFMPELSFDITGVNTNQTFVQACIDGLRDRLGIEEEIQSMFIIDEMKDGTTQTHYKLNSYYDETYIARLEYEINVFVKAQYVEYALLLWDLKLWCKREKIFTGPGRGSGAGSLVLFALYITDVDPIQYNCPFERFINPGRLANFSPPDVDLDFPQSKRGIVLDYLRARYGMDRVCQIGTYASLGPAALVRKLKVPLGISEDDIAELTASIPTGEGSVQGRGAAGDIGSSMTIEDVLMQSVGFRKKIEQMGETGRLIIEYGRGLAFLGDHASTHASGLIITNRPVDQLAPLMTVKGNASTRDVMTQMDMSDVEALGLIKFDILGLKTLDVIAYVQEQIRSNHDPSFDFLEHVDLNDPAPYRLLHAGRTIGIFQVEGGGFGSLLPQAKPESMEEISILTSLCRPGPMQAGITQLYIARKQGIQQVAYDIPQLEPILNRSLGCIVYQEDLMEIASKCAGYSLAEADDLRKIMGKKQRDKMPYHKQKFLTGLAAVCNVDEIAGNKIWDQLESMAEYVFNRSHACAYSMITVWCCWAKYYYPSYFIAAAMTSETLGDGKELPALLQDARHLGVTVARPDVNQSDLHYHAVDTQNVRIGLLGIHGVGNAAVTAIIAERTARGPFLSRDDFRARIAPRAVNAGVVEALDKAGAFDLLDGRQRRVTVDSLLEELQLFGFFLSGHPCERLRSFWLRSSPDLQTIAQIQASRRTTVMQKWTPHGTKRVEEYVPMLMRGVVTRYASKKSKSKAGEILHFFDVEDETGVVKIFLKQKNFDKLGLLTIDKGMGLEIFGAKSMQASRVGYITPTLIRYISFTP
jgi:DNA polymerase-3 subunit alpha